MTKDKLDGILMALLGSQEFVSKWWDSPNANWGFRTPNEVFETKAGQIEIVNYLLQHTGYTI